MEDLFSKANQKKPKASLHYFKKPDNNQNHLDHDFFQNLEATQQRLRSEQKKKDINQELYQIFTQKKKKLYQNWDLLDESTELEESQLSSAKSSIQRPVSSTNVWGIFFSLTQPINETTSMKINKKRYIRDLLEIVEEKLQGEEAEELPPNSTFKFYQKNQELDLNKRICESIDPQEVVVVKFTLPKDLDSKSKSSSLNDSYRVKASEQFLTKPSYFKLRDM